MVSGYPTTPDQLVRARLLGEGARNLSTGDP